MQVDASNPWLVVGSALSGQTELPKAPAEETASTTLEVREEKSLEKTTEENEEESGSEDGEDVSSDEEEEEGEEEGDGKSEEVPSKSPTKGAVIVRNVPSLDQEMLVDMAFANDDVVAQFKEEKEKTVDQETEKVRLTTIY